MSEILVTLDGVALPMGWAGDLSAESSDLGGFTRLRMADGSTVYQERWKKRRLRITGNDAWRPPAFHGVDWGNGFTLGWIEPEGQIQAGNVFTLPTARRTDLAPFAFAVINGWEVPAAVAVAGDTATVTPTAGAQAYSCHWYPLLTMTSDGPTTRHDITTGSFSWELTAEEA